MNKARWLAIWGGATCFVYLALCALIGVVMAEGALHPGRNRLRAADVDSAREIALRRAATLRDVTVTAADGVVLRAWWIQPAAPNSTAVILLHGQSDNRAGMLGDADLMLRHGNAVLLPDARAHGQSDGKIATYGVLERDDIARWAQWITQADHPACIDGLGDSMGAAQVLESMSAWPQFCAVVGESGFATFRQAAYVRMGQQFGTGPALGRNLLRPAVEVGLLYARLRYGVNPGQASPLAAVEGTSTPVLLIHGLADSNLPPSQSEEMAKTNPAVTLWEPAGVDHCGALGALPAEYERRVIAFFDQNRGQSAPETVRNH